MNGLLLWIWRIAAARLFQRVVLPAGEKLLVGRGALYGTALGLAGILLMLIFQEKKVVKGLSKALFDPDKANDDGGNPIIDIDNPEKTGKGKAKKRIKNR